jgi:HEAT repeat protein
VREVLLTIVPILIDYRKLAVQHLSDAHDSGTGTRRRSQQTAVLTNSGMLVFRTFAEARAGLHSNRTRIREAAVDALYSIGARRALSPILGALSDRSWKVRMRAAQLAGRLLAGRKVRPEFLKLLRDPHYLVRLQAAESLAEIGDRAAIRLLRRTLRDRSPLVRSYAAATIGELGGPREEAVLQSSLHHEKSAQARLGLLAALYALGDTSALSLLVALLESDDFEVRLGTAATLVRSIAKAANARDIEKKIRKALRHEESVNARYHLRHLLKELDLRFPDSPNI